MLAAAEQFEAVELSPLAPLGVCSVVGLASQNKIVSALRGTEVVSDPTNVLALECARRLRDRRRRRRSPGHVSPGRARATGAEAIGVCAALPHLLPGQCGPRAEGPGVRCLGALHATSRPSSPCWIASNVPVFLSRIGASPSSRRPSVRLSPTASPSGVSGLTVERRPLDHPYYDGLRYMLWSGAERGRRRAADRRRRVRLDGDADGEPEDGVRGERDGITAGADPVPLVKLVDIQREIVDHPAATAFSPFLETTWLRLRRRRLPRRARRRVPGKPNAAFMKPVTPSEQLAAVVGSKPIPRTEVTKRLWAYIKKNKLQDPKNKRHDQRGRTLKAVFGGKGTVNMFAMTKLVSKHLK